MTASLREATRGDVPAIHRVRLSVAENRLTSAIAEADYIAAIERTGRGWVIEVQGQVVAFAIGNGTTGNIWALFVHPAHEHRGFGRQLHDVITEWLFSNGLDRLWLTTDAGTRAERLYRAAGWTVAGRTESGELILERYRTRG